MADEAIALSARALARELSQQCEIAGSQTAWARQHEIAISVVSETIRGIRDPSQKIINALGYMQVTRYVPVRRRVAA